jgi:hypothetical protein
MRISRQEIKLGSNVKRYFVIDRLCGLVLRVPGYGTEIFCVSCELQTEYLYMLCRRKLTASVV